VLPSLIGPDEILGANSAVWSAAVVSQIALAPLAGVLVATSGAGPAFLINAASFLISAGLLWSLPVPAGPARLPQQRIEDLAAGLRTVRKSRFVSTMAGVHILAALSAGATSALLVVLAERHLRVGAGHFGVLLGTIGVGAALGPLVVSRAVREIRRPLWLFGPYLLRGIVDLVLASFGAALGALACYGVATSTGSVAYATTLQTTVPDQVRGRDSPASASAACWPTPLGSPPSSTSEAACSSPPQRPGCSAFATTRSPGQAPTTPDAELIGVELLDLPVHVQPPGLAGAFWHYEDVMPVAGGWPSGVSRSARTV
jgi:MFS family permease